MTSGAEEPTGPRRFTVSISHRALLTGGVVVGAILIGVGAFALGHATTSHSQASVSQAGTSRSTSTTRPTAPITTTTAAPTTTAPLPPPTTNPLRQVLAPATVQSVTNECAVAVTTSADGNVSPLFGPGGCLNTNAWHWYASSYPQFMAIGPNVTETQVITAMCDITNKTLPTLESASQLAAAYYGWGFASDPAFDQWPFYPNYSSNECGG